MNAPAAWSGPGPLVRILTVATALWIVVATVLHQWWLLYIVGALFMFSIICLYLEGRLITRDLATAEHRRQRPGPMPSDEEILDSIRASWEQAEQKERRS